MLRAVVLNSLSIVLSLSYICNSCTAADWLDASDPEVVESLCVADNQFSWYGGPGGQEEWLLNFGASTQTRLKGYQDVTALKFDLASYRGRTVIDAELHLAKSDSNPIFALVASTISADWNEGRGWGSEARTGESCWRWSSRPADPDHPTPGDEWTFSHSDFSSAAFGNFCSLVSYAYKASGTFASYSDGRQTWLKMKLDRDLVYALILDQYGLVVTDPRGYNYDNPRIYTHNESTTLSPRLLIRFATERDTSPPKSVQSLKAEAGLLDGEVILSFEAANDPETYKAFGYTVRVSQSVVFDTASEVPRWRIPRPKLPGKIQKMSIEGLQPGTRYHFFVRAYDQSGNGGPVSSVEFTLPDVQTTASLAQGNSGNPGDTSQPVRSAAETLRYWACPEVTKVNPVTGNRMEDGYGRRGSDGYKKTNPVWDATGNSISLTASRNEAVGFQLILERLNESLTNVVIESSDLKGPDSATITANPNIETFLLHYVKDGSLWYPDAAIPLFDPFPKSFAIPDRAHNPDGVNQSVWFDCYIPKTAVSGMYTGTVSIRADELTAPVIVQLKIHVGSVTIPDELSFIIDLNGYGNRWEYGNTELTRLRWFQACHKHRMSLNTLPYGWNATVRADRAPRLTGSGANVRMADWSAFDNAYGAFFDGSAFRSDTPASAYTGPGTNTPVSTFYTSFFESWPIHALDPNYGFDAAGRGGAYWNNLIDTDKNAFWTDAPDVRNAFGEEYKQGVRNIVKEWFEHAEAKGWHGTNFQIYLNHKYSYSNCDALWILEECSTADDFKAVGFFHSLYREGYELAEAPRVKWHWRIDISDRWGQNYGQLDNLINWYVMNGSSSDWHWPHIRYRNLMHDVKEQWVWYGTGPAPSDPGTGHIQRFLQAWAQGLDGGVPYWDNFQTSWTNANALSTVYSGESVPGFGRYDGPIVSIRVKMMRQAQQMIELANLLARQPGWNRERVTQALLEHYGSGEWNRAFKELNDMDLYQLRADLTATLEPFFQSGMNVNEYMLVR